MALPEPVGGTHPPTDTVVDAGMTMVADTWTVVTGSELNAVNHPLVSITMVVSLFDLQLCVFGANKTSFADEVPLMPYPTGVVRGPTQTVDVMGFTGSFSTTSPTTGVMAGNAACFPYYRVKAKNNVAGSNGRCVVNGMARKY